jgi:thiamine-phosphate pyrophosphorylase
MARFDPRARRGLYAIVDPAACLGCDPVGVAAAILRGGCAILQLRDKTSSDRRVLELARAIAPLCRGAGVPFVVDDRLDVALACDADGVHVGQDDLPLADARRLAPDLVIGVSTHGPSQRRAAEDGGADLVGFGPVFATRTKENPDPVVGLEALAATVRVARVPVVAIGGISEENVDRVIAAGAPLYAVISAVCGASDPAAAAAALHRRGA